MIDSQFLYEDNHLLALNKNSGQLVQADKSGDACLLDMVRAHIKARDGKPGRVFIGLPHRLDRSTSGVILLAKTTKALGRLSASFRERNCRKLYWAITEDAPREPAGELVHWLKKDEQSNIARITKAGSPGAKEARLRYRLLGASKCYFLVEIELLSGRHHQIRAQMAAIACPVRGDIKYGAKRSKPGGGICLHACLIEIPHPTRIEALNIIAPLPNEPLWNAFTEFFPQSPRRRPSGNSGGKSIAACTWSMGGA